MMKTLDYVRIPIHQPHRARPPRAHYNPRKKIAQSSIWLKVNTDNMFETMGRIHTTKLKPLVGTYVSPKRLMI